MYGEGDGRPVEGRGLVSHHRLHLDPRSLELKVRTETVSERHPGFDQWWDETRSRGPPYCPYLAIGVRGLGFPYGSSGSGLSTRLVQDYLLYLPQWSLHKGKPLLRQNK